MENENKKVLCDYVEEIDECIICYIESELKEVKKEINFFRILFIIQLISTILFSMF